MSLPYFPMFPTDFEAKTSHLTLAEDGAYNRLLRLMWMTPGCTLPADESWIKRRMRVDQDTYDEVVKVVIDEFFTVEKGRLSNAKLARIFIETSEAHKKRVEAGSKGGKTKALKTNSSTLSKAKAMPKQPEPEPEPEPIEKEPIGSQKTDLFPIDDPPKRKAPAKACQMPDGWVPSDRNIQDAIDRNFSKQEIDNEADRFRNYCQANGKTYKNWDAGWRTWLGNARKFSRGGSTGGNTGIDETAFAARFRRTPGPDCF